MSQGRIESWNVRFGALLWLVCAGLEHPHPMTFPWPLMMVLLGAFVLVPVGRILCGRQFNVEASKWIAWLQTPAAISLAISVQQNSGLVSAGFAVPWLVLTGLMALTAFRRWRKFGHQMGKRLALVGWLQLAVGGAWLLADRAGMEPLEFDGQIVRLTAAHFHFAGFVLPLMAGFLVCKDSETWMRISAIGASGGVMLVATGITSTKLGGPLWIEALLGAGFSVFVILLSLGQMRLAVRLRNGWLLASGTALGAAMILALTYSLRIWIPIPWLHIPRMWAIHGTLQVFGFAALGLIGWALELKRPGLASTIES